MLQIDAVATYLSRESGKRGGNRVRSLIVLGIEARVLDDSLASRLLVLLDFLLYIVVDSTFEGVLTFIGNRRFFNQLVIFDGGDFILFGHIELLHLLDQLSAANVVVVLKLLDAFAFAARQLCSL